MPVALATTGVKTLPDVSISHSLIQMVIALVVIVGCIWGLGKILTRLRSGGRQPKRHSAAGNRKTAGGGLSVVSRQSLGKDVSIATVQWGDREVLVGIAGSTITFLNDARSEETPAAGDAAETWLGSGSGFLPPTGDPFGAGRTDAPRRLASVAARQALDAGIAEPERPTSFIEALRNATQRR